MDEQKGARREIETNMNKETHELFVLGLREAITKSGMSQKEFASGITTEVNLSRVLNNISGTSHGMRQLMADRLGMKVYDIILLGKQVYDDQEKAGRERQDETGADLHVATTQATSPVQQLTEFITAYSKLESDVLFWQSAFEQAATATCILYKGKVICQNAAHRKIVGRSYVGKEACPNCGSEGEHHHECNVSKTMATGEPGTSQIYVNDEQYRSDSSTFIAGGELYTVATLKSCQALFVSQRANVTLKAITYSLLDSAHAGTMLIDRRGGVNHCNQKLESMFGVRHDFFKTITDLFGWLLENASDPTEAMVALRRSQSKTTPPDPAQIEVRGKRFWLELKPVGDEEGSWLGTILRTYDDKTFQALFGDGHAG